MGCLAWLNRITPSAPNSWPHPGDHRTCRAIGSRSANSTALHTTANMKHARRVQAQAHQFMARFAMRRDLLVRVAPIQAPSQQRLREVQASTKAIGLVLLILVVTAYQDPQLRRVSEARRLVPADNVGHLVHASGLPALGGVSGVLNDNEMGVDRKRSRRPFRRTRAKQQLLQLRWKSVDGPRADELYLEPLSQFFRRQKLPRLEVNFASPVLSLLLGPTLESTLHASRDESFFRLLSIRQLDHLNQRIGRISGEGLVGTQMCLN